MVDDLEQLGYQKNMYDKCMMTLPPVSNNQLTNDGILLIEVDDILEGGGKRHSE